MTLTMLFRTGCAALLCLPLMVSGGSYTYIDVYVWGGDIYRTLQN